MRVLFVLPTAKMYGDNIALLNILTPLVNKGVEPLFLVRRDSDIEKILNEKGYKTLATENWLMTCYNLNTSKIRSILRFFKGYIFTYYGLLRDRHLIRQIKLFSPDIIYTNNSLCLTGYYYARKLKVIHLFHIREYVDKDADLKFWPSKSSFMKRLKTTGNYNITITKEIKDHFSLTSNTIVIYDGVVKEEEVPIIHPHKHNYFLYAGRLTYTKGVPLIIESFYTFCQNNNEYDLLIAGDGSEKGTFVDMTKSLGIQNKVKFLGYRDDVKNLMADAKALIVASRYEAFGFITAEAMFNGCLVIGFNTGGTAEQFNNMDERVKFKNSYRFVSKDELACNMMHAIQHELTYSQLKEMSNHVYEMYSVDASSKSVYNYLMSICQI